LHSWTGDASPTRYATRRARTAVFPDPAAAETMTLLPVVSTASRCRAVSENDAMASEIIAALLRCARLHAGVSENPMPVGASNPFTNFAQVARRTAWEAYRTVNSGGERSTADRGIRSL